ncbi:MAG TPA: GDSL-type esterase/lipase family protein [Thermoleophilaceae bacterium]|nr:GDSL-type esterase/lipase family protein [Thermoleophilaceae bacterium]
MAVALALLLLFKGTSIRDSGEEMQPGLGRTVVLAVGRPAGWLAEKLPFADVGDRAFGWLSPDDALEEGAGFASGGGEAAREGAVPPVSPESFDDAALGDRPKRPPPLKKLLVTGDSLAQPLDVELARRLADDGVRVERDPHIGTGVSKSDFVDWGKLSSQQTRKLRPDAVVVFIGANEGFPMRAPHGGGGKVNCCGSAWAAAYAFRVRRIMNTYRRRGAARVYYLRLPLPREKSRQKIARAVNAAIDVAAVPYGAHVRVLDMTRIFTPGGRYRATMTVDGSRRIVRRPDGIHLSDVGACIAANAVLAAIRRDYERR